MTVNRCFDFLPPFALLILLKSENENQHDKLAVAIVLKERIVGHVPKNLSKIFHQFRKIPNCSIGCKVTGKRGNHGAGYGLEIPVQ